MNSCSTKEGSVNFCPCSLHIVETLFLVCLAFKCAWKNFVFESPVAIQTALDFCLYTFSCMPSYFSNCTSISFSSKINWLLKRSEPTSTCMLCSLSFRMSTRFSTKLNVLLRLFVLPPRICSFFHT